MLQMSPEKSISNDLVDNVLDLIGVCIFYCAQRALLVRG